MTRGIYCYYDNTVLCLQMDERRGRKVSFNATVDPFFLTAAKLTSSRVTFQNPRLRWRYADAAAAAV